MMPVRWHRGRKCLAPFLTAVAMATIEQLVVVKCQVCNPQKICGYMVRHVFSIRGLGVGFFLFCCSTLGWMKHVFASQNELCRRHVIAKLVDDVKGFLNNMKRCWALADALKTKQPAGLARLGESVFVPNMFSMICNVSYQDTPFTQMWCSQCVGILSGSFRVVRDVSQWFGQRHVTVL